MNVLLGLLCLLPYYLYYWTKAVLLAFIPRRIKAKKNISGQTILITGAGSGVGRQLAIEFSKYSTCLVLLDINRSSLLDTEKMMDRSSRVFLYECDVSQSENVYKVAKIIKKDAGKVDILVNNAGIVSGRNLIDLTDDQIKKTVGVNTLAHFWTCKAFLPDMIASNKGHIVSVTSVAGIAATPRLTDYCASKYAAVGLAESLELELQLQGLNGIKVTVVLPAAISTGLFEGLTPPLGDFITPEYVAQEIVAGVLEEKHFLFIPGWFMLAAVLKWITPYSVMIKGYKMFGLLYCMDTFKGRKPNSNLTQKIK